LAIGADGIELDVRLARDGVPVVIHDATLRRTGLIAGRVGDLDAAQLAQVEVGTWFNRAHPKFARDEFTGECVPTLPQVFELCGKRRATIYVEMKSEGDGTAKDLASAVAKLVNAFNFQDRVVVVSFNLAAIGTVKKFDSSIRTGALFGSTSMTGRNWPTTLLARAADCGADELLLHNLLTRRKLVEKAHEANFPIVVWTVDDVKWVERARIRGLHALITNHPAKLLTAR